jgi:signal transduction histidine kinase
MTLRLVAVMSVVLLLSLAAFGLMINHYQDQVMEEVARTASEVGRATLRSIEAHGPGVVFETVPDGSAEEWISWQTEQAGSSEGEGTGGEATVDVQVKRVGPEDHDKVVQSWVTTGVVPVGVVRETHDTAHVSIVCEAEDGETLRPEDCVTTDGESVLDLHNNFFVDIEGVRAEADPSEGMVLKIKRFKPESKPGEAQFVSEDVRLAADDPVMVFTRTEDISLPIPIQEYDSLFASVRKRSLWMFLGVFVVGTALSAGLASRFTRPIRRLDAGIRQLSAGDLEVQVPARGSDEIARLGRAFNDMTRSLRANRQRSREMVRREKHSALGRLAAGVAHDIRNPLHSIGLTLQHLRETCRPEADEAAEEFDRSVDIIRGEIRRLDQLVGNFLSFAKSEARQRHQVDLRELLTETARLVRKEAEWRRVDVQLDLDQSAPSIEADGEAMRSSILNLVLNSFEAMPDGGRLRLSLRTAEEGAVLEVADTGEGIPPQDQDRVFDFAYTTKDGGNGLGLAMVYQCIVEDHGGQVGLESETGGGTVVRMTLPLGDGSTREGVG